MLHLVNFIGVISAIHMHIHMFLDSVYYTECISPGCNMNLIIKNSINSKKKKKVRDREGRCCKTGGHIVIFCKWKQGKKRKMRQAIWATPND